MENDLKELELLLAIDENTVETVRNIRQAKKELETTFDSITDVVLLVNVDGNIIRGNRAIGVWTSREVTKIEGLFFHDLFHPGCHDAKCHMISYWHLAREKIHNKKAFEYQIMDRLLNRFLLVQFRPISQEKTGTRKNFAVVTFKDITQNKQAQVQLDQTTAELSTIFKVLPDQYIRLNWDGTILDLRVNRNSKSSVLPMESAGNRIQDCFPQKVGEKFRQAITEVLQKRSKVVVEYSLLIDKAEEFFEARLLPLLQNNIIVINRNITENKRLESIAESVDMMKNLGYIFSGIRHEIGNPINAIKMTMSVLKKNISVFSKAKVLEYADRALTEINRVEYLLKSFKNFNMFETLDIEAIDIVRFLRNFLSLIWEDFKAKGIVIHLDAGDDRNSVRADTRALHQVLLNIIGNAAEAMEERETPFIHISTHYMASTGTMNIIVRDNGQGIPQSQVKNLFKPFYTTKVEGTGLGLVIVKKILSRMEGEIAVSSVENKGTTVTISLPGAKLL